MHLDLIVALLAIAAAAALVYGPLLVGANGFCFDDRLTMTHLEEWDRDGRSGGLFYAAITTGIRQPWQNGRYLSWRLLRLLYVRLGMSRRGWLLVGVASHALNGGLVYLLARELGVDAGAATAGAVLFTVHPMAVMGAALVGGLASAWGTSCLLAGAIALGLHAWWAVGLLGIAAVNLKLDGWAYWPVMGGLWLLWR